MSKAKDTLEAAYDALKKEIEKEPMDAERVRALTVAVSTLEPISRMTKSEVNAAMARGYSN